MSELISREDAQNAFAKAYRFCGSVREIEAAAEDNDAFGRAWNALKEVRAKEVAIKPLVWRERGLHLDAIGINRVYKIAVSPNLSLVRLQTRYMGTWIDVSSVDRAKEVAQADHDAEVRKLIEGSQVDALMICDGCGSSMADEEVIAGRAAGKFLSCCPERKLRLATSEDWDKMRRRAREAEEELTAEKALADLLHRSPKGSAADRFEANVAYRKARGL